MTSRISLAVASLVAALALGACGGGNTSVSARQESTTTTSSSTTTTTTTTTVPASTAPPASSAPSSTALATLSGFKAVEYSGLRFQVPDDWPVYDLAKDSNRCVRFDQHAVYLGHAGANQNCPAQLVGTTEAVHVEPIDAVSQNTASTATAPGTINGLSVHLDPNSAITRNLVAAFDDLGLVATVTFRQSDALAQQILGTFERAGG
jgi:hypothetical protein